MNDVNNRIFYEFSEFLKETESVPPEMRVSLAYEITIKSTIASALIEPSAGAAEYLGFSVCSVAGR